MCGWTLIAFMLCLTVGYAYAVGKTEGQLIGRAECAAAVNAVLDEQEAK